MRLKKKVNLFDLTFSAAFLCFSSSSFLKQFGAIINFSIFRSFCDAENIFRFEKLFFNFYNATFSLSCTMEAKFFAPRKNLKKCIINNMKIDFSWKVFLLLEANKQEWRKKNKIKMELLLARRRSKRSLKLRQLCFWEGSEQEKTEEEMSSGELSFYNLYEFFHQQQRGRLQLGKLFRWHLQRKKGFHVLYGKEQKKKGTSQNFNPEFSFSPAKTRRKDGKASWNGRGKLSYCSVIPSMWKYHSIMLWMFHVLRLLCSSHLQDGGEAAAAGIWMLFRKCEQQPSEDGSEKILLQHREMLFISWGKWKCQSEHEIYDASSLFWVMIRLLFHSIPVPSSRFHFATGWREERD